MDLQTQISAESVRRTVLLDAGCWWGRQREREEAERWYNKTSPMMRRDRITVPPSDQKNSIVYIFLRHTAKKREKI